MPITEIDIELQTAPLAVTLEVQQGITSLSNIITTGYTSGHMLRIASGGGLEGRTPAQVLADIGGQAALSNYSTITALTGYPSTFPPTIGNGPGEAVAGNDSRLHAAATVSGNGIQISGQQISLSIGTGSNQVAAGNHGHTAAEVGAVGLTGNETVGGDKNLTGQTTMPNQTAAAANSAMNRNLSAAMFAMSPAVHSMIPFTSGTVTGAGSTVGAVHGGVTLLTLGNAANASARVKICEDFGFSDANQGNTFGFSMPFSIRVPLAFGILASGNAFVIRIYVCTQGTMALPAAGAEPYAANTRGIVAELRHQSEGTGWEARLCARDGAASSAGTFIASEWVAISANNATKHYDVTIVSDGNGKAKLFITSFAMSAGQAPPSWHGDPVATLSGAGVPKTNENVATFWSRPEVAVIGDGVATPGAARYVKLFQCCAVYGVAL